MPSVMDLNTNVVPADGGRGLGCLLCEVNLENRMRSSLVGLLANPAQ